MRFTFREGLLDDELHTIYSKYIRLIENDHILPFPKEKSMIWGSLIDYFFYIIATTL